MPELLKNKIELDNTFDFNQLTELMDKGAYKTKHVAQIPNNSEYILENSFQLVHPEKTCFFNDLLKIMDGHFNKENKKSDLRLFFSFKASSGQYHRDIEEVNILGLYGRTIYSINNQHYYVEKGDVLRIKKGILHRSMSLGPRIILSHGVYY